MNDPSVAEVVTENSYAIPQLGIESNVDNQQSSCRLGDAQRWASEGDSLSRYHGLISPLSMARVYRCLIDLKTPHNPEKL